MCYILHLYINATRKKCTIWKYTKIGFYNYVVNNGFVVPWHLCSSFCYIIMIAWSIWMLSCWKSVCQIWQGWVKCAISTEFCIDIRFLLRSIEIWTIVLLNNFILFLETPSCLVECICSNEFPWTTDIMIQCYQLVILVDWK